MKLTTRELLRRLREENVYTEFKSKRVSTATLGTPDGTAIYCRSRTRHPFDTPNRWVYVGLARHFSEGPLGFVGIYSPPVRRSA